MFSADEQKKRYSVTLAITVCRKKTAPQTALLLPMLFVIGVIQLLPQVDLPDTALQRNTAPIIAKSRAVSPATFRVVIEDVLLTPVRTLRVILSGGSSMPAHPVNVSLSILFSVLLC